jgi:predicted ATP-dependent protease
MNPSGLPRPPERGGPGDGERERTGTIDGPDQPLSLSATLVFEQSYGPVEGDSASSTELFALLSALAGLPVTQSLAVTGAVNQRGDIQAIGGVNEKIEGFFDVRKARGLAGTQGVIIPAANVRDLMLRPDVVDAAGAAPFTFMRSRPSMREWNC